MNIWIKKNGILLLLVISLFFNMYYQQQIKSYKYRQDSLIKLEMNNIHYSMVNFGIMLEYDDISLEDVRIFEIMLNETSSRLGYLVSNIYHIAEPYNMHKLIDYIYYDIRAVVTKDELSPEIRRQKLDSFAELAGEISKAFEVKSGSKDEVEASFIEFNSILGKYNII